DQWITAADFSADGRWLATGSIDTNVKLWDLTAPNEVLQGAGVATHSRPADPVLLTGHSATVRSVVFSDDGRWTALAGDDASAYLWEFSGQRTIPGKLLLGHAPPITHVVFSPDAGRRHIVTLGDDRHARLWTIPGSVVDPIVLRGHKVGVGAA